MSRRQQETAFPLQRVDTFYRPTQDDHERAKEKAHQLFKSILPAYLRTMLEEKGVVQITGQRGIYIISPYTHTKIKDLKSGQCMAYSCLQLTIPAPTHDRMMAEYLLIKNAEDVYWKTANIFICSGNGFGIATLFLIAFDSILFINLLMEVLTY